MKPSFSPSLAFVLNCPRRFQLEKVRRERILAPFAAGELGIQVHRRIAHSLRKNKPADEQAFCLPKRLLLQEGEDLEDLRWRAHAALTFFNVKCRAWLSAHTVSQVEHFISRSYQLEGKSLKLSGILDLVLESPKGDVLIDWKTGSVAHSEDQLKFYLMLRYLETGQVPRRAEAISLSLGESLCVEWDESLPEWFEAKLGRMRRKLEACYGDIPKAGWHCKYCPYAHSCEQSEAPERYVLDTFTGEFNKISRFYI